MLLVMFQAWQGINPQVFPASTWKLGHVFLFSTFQTLDYTILEMFKQMFANLHTFTELEREVVQGAPPTIHLRTDDVT